MAHTAAKLLSIEFHYDTCAACGGAYAITESHRAHCHARGKYWHCPYCQTSWGYVENDIERANNRANKAEAKAAEEQRKRTIAEWDHQATKNTLRTTKGHHTRLKKRITRGVCPCCERPFPDVGAHIREKHPEYSEANE